MNINATLLAQAVVMIVFVAICWKYVYPPILSMMKEREKRISDGLEAAKKADDSLEEAKLAFDKELNQAKAEAAEILEKANARASQIVTDASSKAEVEAEKILTSAATTIENETNKAKEELRQQMSDIIIDTTQKILGDEISKEKHNDDYSNIAKEFKLIFIEKIPKMTNDYSDQCRRFISLIDMLYENKCSVVILAENPISSLCQISNLSKEFERTASRLYEMTIIQSS